MPRLASLQRNFPTVRLLIAPFRWIGKSRRRIWCVVLVLLAIVAGPPLCWATQLWGLPDIGDPFDVAAFRAMTIPDDRNAFVLYRQAATLLKPLTGYLKTSQTKVDMLARWSQADPDLRRWAEGNREAIAVYREGAQRPDALDPPLGLDREGFKTIVDLWSLRPMVLLEASRLEAQGDMAGAWDWYRALLRTVHHVGLHGDVYRRDRVRHWHRDLRTRLTTWAADARTSRALLHRALDDVLACETLAASEVDSLKAGYLGVIGLLDSAKNPGREVPLMRVSRFWNPDYQLNPEQIQAIWDAWRFWRREPERSRRVIRLVMAIWLAYLDLPPDQRPDPDPNVASLDFYRFGPGAPAKARVLSPEALDRWLGTTVDAQDILREFNGRPLRIREHADHRALVVLLGTQLYRRDHGTDPPDSEALVGPYLKRLPAEFPDDVKGQSISGARGTDQRGSATASRDVPYNDVQVAQTGKSRATNAMQANQA